jgi:predicted nucleic acid-binding protein
VAGYFLDSSALVKRYVAEPGSARVTALIDPTTGNRIYLAHTTVVEVAAAIARRVREGTLAVAAAKALRRKFFQDVAARFQLMNLDDDVVDRAVSLTELHPLRAADAIQLATALNVNEDRIARNLSPLVVACSDQSLLKAAVAEGLATEDPAAQVP